MKLRLYLPLVLHIVPTAVIAYLWVIPNGPVAGINDHSIGFATTLLGTIATYHAGIRLARRVQPAPTGVVAHEDVPAAPSGRRGRVRGTMRHFLHADR